jgi:hypothetical protein
VELPTTAATLNWPTVHLAAPTVAFAVEFAVEFTVVVAGNPVAVVEPLTAACAAEECVAADVTGLGVGVDSGAAEVATGDEVWLSAAGVAECAPPPLGRAIQAVITARVRTAASSTRRRRQ